MYLALVYFPQIDHEGFHAFRNKYEPYADLLREHLTFVFPIPESIGREELEEHISEVLSHQDPFKAHFCQLEKTVDHWLFWTPEEGRELAVGLHDELYSGILSPHLKADLPYTPHIGLGLFSTENYDFNDPYAELTLDTLRYQRARKEFEELNIDLWCSIDHLAMVRINEDFTECTELRRFSF
jgi:hypothetical protein